MMTKKDYELLAATLRIIAKEAEHHSGHAVPDFAELLPQIFAGQLAGTSPRFYRERFLRACQPESASVRGSR